jgi:phosphoglucosamine mutase
MVYRLYIEKREGLENEARAAYAELSGLLGITSLRGVRLLNRYDVEGIAEDVFRALGARVVTIGCEPDGLNINRDVGSTHIERLAAFVKTHHLDAGFAFDGDADRCLAVDESGNVLTGDHILYALAGEWRRRGLLTGDTVVTTIMSNMGLYRALDEAGIHHVQTAVGDKYVYEAMNKGDFSIGGEASGHIILRPYAQTGDGILTAIQLMELAVGRKLPLSRVAAEVRMFPQRQYNLRVTNKAAVLQSATVQNAVRQAEEALGKRGRIVLRESGTEPVIRLMVEADTDALCDMTATALRDLMLSQGF